MDHLLIRRAYEYWLSRRTGAGLPRRSAIDPVDIPHLLPYVALAQVAGNRAPEDAPDFLIRIAGEHLVRIYGGELHSRHMSELVTENPSAGVWQDAMRTSLATGAPHFGDTLIRSLTGTPRRTKLGVLPLAEDDENTVAHLLFVSTAVDD